MIHLISLEIVWLLFSLWQNMVCHFVEPKLWLHKMADRVALVVFAVTTGWTAVISRLYSYLICFIWTLSLHEKERLNRIHEMLQNCMYSYFEIVLSYNPFNTYIFDTHALVTTLLSVKWLYCSDSEVFWPSLCVFSALTWQWIERQLVFHVWGALMFVPKINGTFSIFQWYLLSHTGIFVRIWRQSVKMVTVHPKKLFRLTFLWKGELVSFLSGLPETVLHPTISMFCVRVFSSPPWSIQTNVCKGRYTIWKVFGLWNYTLNAETNLPRTDWPFGMGNWKQIIAVSYGSEISKA